MLCVYWKRWASDQVKRTTWFHIFHWHSGEFPLQSFFFTLFLIFLLNLYFWRLSPHIFLRYMWSYSLKRAFHFGDRTSQSFSYFPFPQTMHHHLIEERKKKKETSIIIKNKRVRRHTHRDIFLAWCQQAFEMFEFCRLQRGFFLLLLGVSSDSVSLHSQDSEISLMEWQIFMSDVH